MNTKQSADKLNSEIDACYQRAQKFLEGYRTTKLVRNDSVFPNWINGTDCFWYERTLEQAKEYRLVNANTATTKLAFDNDVLSAALAQTSGQIVSKDSLPISHIDIKLSPLIVRFNAFGKRWKFDDGNKTCKEIASGIVPITEALSPDGAQIAFTQDYNIWLRDVVSGKEWALTYDGEEDYFYGACNTAWGVMNRPEIPGLWSPDGTLLLTVRRDKRLVKTLPMINHVPNDGSIRPQLTLAKVAYPGDKHVETYKLLTLNVITGEACEVHYRSIPASFNDYLGFFGKLAWWAADSRRVYFIDQTRGDRVVRLVEFDTNNGTSQILFEEVSDTYINIMPDITTAPLHRFLCHNNELIWWSERSGWGHLYLYDLNTGELKHAITNGDWRVRNVLKLDEARREVWLQTSGRVPGRDPYYRDVCRVNIDTGKITTLLSCDEETVVYYLDSYPVLTKKYSGEANIHTCGVSPNAEYVVVTRSRADQIPITVLMNRDGREILKLEKADISALPTGWQWPEPVELLSADGKTNIHGLIFRPSSFSPDKRYPVLNYIFSAPYLSVVPKGSFHCAGGYVRHYFHGAALAELGFIVLFLDSRGTPGRSKVFQEKSYAWVPASANKDDHISGLRQLAERYPYMDMDRVGVLAYGYPSGLQSFLECQEVYKVCVVMNVLDNRLISCTIEGDKWQGCGGPNEDKCYPEQLVVNLQGKLLLMHSMTSATSPAYPPAALFRVIDALQKANKDFDMLVIPNTEFMFNNYMLRRALDYLVKHLLEIESPKEFKLEGIAM